MFFTDLLLSLAMNEIFNEGHSDNSGSIQTQRLFVDEAGDPTLFHASGKAIVDTEGCSRFFIIGKLEVDDPPALAQSLTGLRQELIADPYFAGVESFRPERKKTALLFHAKDDLPEVRYRVFNLLRAVGSALRFHAVVCDKQVLLKSEMERRAQDPRYRYQPDTIYDGLIRSLCSKFHRLADRYEICVAKRGAKDRNQAIRTAIEHAERDFEQKFGFSRGGGDAWTIVISNPKETVCLQAVDYFLWAVQRFYEVRLHPTTGEKIREDRYLKLLWPQIGEIHDLDFGPARGTYFTAQHPLTLEERFGRSGKKKKKS
jgi:hypothetical protein